MEENCNTTTLNVTHFIGVHIIARKLLDLSDKELIYLGSDKRELIQLCGKHKYLTIKQKEKVEKIVARIASRIDLFRIVDKDFCPPYRAEFRRKRPGGSVSRANRLDDIGIYL